MNNALIKKQLDDFVLKSHKYLNLSTNDEETRRKRFDIWIERASEEDEQVQPYARLTVCSKIINQALWGSDEEIAYYIGVVLDDIGYAANKEFDPQRDRYRSLLRMKGGQHELFIRIIARELTIEQVTIYLDALIDAYQLKNQFCHTLHSLLYALRAYVDIGNYDFAVKLGGLSLDIYESHEADYSSYKQDTEAIVGLINLEIFRAHEKLGTATKEMIAVLKKSRPELQKAKSDAEIAEITETRINLMNQAESCRADGDIEGYYDKMSKANEVGQ